jgi:hypothetical protein
MKLLTTFVLKVQRDGVGGGGFVGRGSAGSVCGAVVPLTMFRLCLSTPVYCNYWHECPPTDTAPDERGRTPAHFHFYPSPFSRAGSMGGLKSDSKQQT